MHFVLYILGKIVYNNSVRQPQQIMKLLKKATLPTLKENFKVGDKIYVTTWDFDGRTSVQNTNLYIIQKVNRVTLHVLNERGDVFVMDPHEHGTKITFAKH